MKLFECTGLGDKKFITTNGNPLVFTWHQVLKGCQRSSKLMPLDTYETPDLAWTMGKRIVVHFARLALNTDVEKLQMLQRQVQSEGYRIDAHALSQRIADYHRCGG